MLSSIALVAILALISGKVSANIDENLPWFLWKNITPPVLVLNPEEEPYVKGFPHLRPTRRPPTRTSRPLPPPSGSPSTAARPLLQPSTNVSEAAGILRFYVCCVCIPEYSCVDGVASLPHYDPNDFDINYEQCPYETDVCCPLLDAPQECRDIQKRSADGPPPPITPDCECLHHELCPSDLVVKYSPDDPRHVNSTCSDELEVCCSLSDLPLEMQTPGGGDGSSNCVCVDQSVCDNIVHLLGITQQDYESFVQSNPPSSSVCSNSSQVCCSIPPADSQATADRLLFQTPAVTYSEGTNCFGYFQSDQLPVSSKAFHSYLHWSVQ